MAHGALYAVLSSLCTLFPVPILTAHNHAPEDTRPVGSDTTWFYRDAQGNEQGPFDSV